MASRFPAARSLAFASRTIARKVSPLDKIAAPAQQAAAGFPNAKPSPVIDLVDSLRSPSFDAGSAVAKIKELRTAADDAFRSGNTDVGRASKSAANALEDALSDHLTRIGQFHRDVLIVTVAGRGIEIRVFPALDPIDAKILAGQLARGKPRCPTLNSPVFPIFCSRALIARLLP